MTKIVESFENESEAEDDFDIEVAEPQQLRPEDSPRPLKLTIRDVTKKFFSFGERAVIWFDEIDDYFLPFDSHLSTLKREIESKKRSAWRGVEIELKPYPYKNKAGEDKCVFACHVLRVPPKPEAASPAEPTPTNSGGVVGLDDEVPFAKW